MNCWLEETNWKLLQQGILPIDAYNIEFAGAPDGKATEGGSVEGGGCELDLVRCSSRTPWLCSVGTSHQKIQKWSPGWATTSSAPKVPCAQGVLCCSDIFLVTLFLWSSSEDVFHMQWAYQWALNCSQVMQGRLSWPLNPGLITDWAYCKMWCWILFTIHDCHLFHLTI